MKNIIFILSLLLAAVAQAQTGAVTKSTASATLNDLTTDLQVPTGKTMAVKSGGTLNGAGTFNFSSGTLTLADNQVGWAKVNKTGSSLANLATRSASDLSSGTLPDARFPATLPAASGVNLTALNASNIASGTLGAARLPSFTLNFSGVLHTTPVTFTNGVGTASLATQSANLVFAGPASGSAAAPTFRALTQVDTQAATSANRNALAPRGVFLDGTAGTRIYLSLTGQDIGSGPYSLVIGMRVPYAIPAVAQGIIGIGSSNTNFDSSIAGSFITNIEPANGGRLTIALGRSAGVYIGVSVFNFITNFAGKDVIIAITSNHSSNAPLVYINGALQSTTLIYTAGAAWTDALTTNYLGIGYQDTSPTSRFVGIVRSASLYNLSLSSSDVQEVYELGGAVPERFKFGSQSAIINSATNNGGFETAGSGGADAFATWLEVANGTSMIARDTVDYYEGVASAKITIGPGAGDQSAYIYGVGGNLLLGRAYELALVAKQTGGATISVQSSGGSSYGTIAPGGSYASSALQFTVSSTGSLLLQCAVKGSVLNIDTACLRRIGAVVHLPFTDQLGLQVRDASTNGLHAERTTTGTYWTDPRQSGRQTLTYTFAHSAISSTAATTTAFILPPNTVLREVQLNRTAAFDASTTLDIGISGTPTKFVTATNVVPTGFAQVASSSLVPESATAVTTVYVKKNQATTTGSVTMNFIIEAVGSPTQ